MVKRIEGRSIISGDRDTIVSRLTDSFSLCNISCRAAPSPAQSSACLFYNFPVTFHHVTDCRRCCFCQEYYSVGYKNQGKLSLSKPRTRCILIFIIPCLVSDWFGANIPHEIWLLNKFWFVSGHRALVSGSCVPGSRLSGREWQRFRNQRNLEKPEWRVTPAWVTTEWWVSGETVTGWPLTTGAREHKQMKAGARARHKSHGLHHESHSHSVNNTPSESHRPDVNKTGRNIQAILVCLQVTVKIRSLQK